jgi:hypothetical protein
MVADHQGSRDQGEIDRSWYEKSQKLRLLWQPRGAQQSNRKDDEGSHHPDCNAQSAGQNL